MMEHSLLEGEGRQNPTNTSVPLILFSCLSLRHMNTNTPIHQHVLSKVISLRRVSGGLNRDLKWYWANRAVIIVKGQMSSEGHVCVKASLKKRAEMRQIRGTLGQDILKHIQLIICCRKQNISWRIYGKERTVELGNLTFYWSITQYFFIH